MAALLAGEFGSELLRAGHPSDAAPAGPSHQPLPACFERRRTRAGPGRLLRGFLAACSRRLRGRESEDLVNPLDLAAGVARVSMPLTASSSGLQRHPQLGLPRQRCRQQAQGLPTAAPGAAATDASCQRSMQLVDSCMDMHAHTFDAKAKAAAALAVGTYPQQQLSSAHLQQLSGHRARAPRRQQVQRRGPLARIGRVLQRLATALGRVVAPKGPGDNDRTALERVLNVVTCLPLFLVGQAYVRRPGGAAFRSYARAMQVVGAVATVYHASSGPVRPYLRKADYYSIALSAAMLRRLLVGRLPRAASAAMLAVLPVKPTFVTVGNLAAVEVKCALQVLSRPRSAPAALWRAWLCHLGICASASSTFLLEKRLLDTAFGTISHASWHCLAAMAVASMGGVLHVASSTTSSV